jgi:hypothetical protein
MKSSLGAVVLSVALAGPAWAESGGKTQEARATQALRLPPDSPYEQLLVKPDEVAGRGAAGFSMTAGGTCPQNEGFTWAKQNGSSSTDQAWANTAFCNAIYTVGYSDGSLDGSANAGGFDAFLTKSDLSGNRLWTKMLGTPVHDYAVGVVVTGTCANPAIYVTGYTNGALDGGANKGLQDLFLARYNASGTQLWVKQVGSSGSDMAQGIAADGQGNVYVTGYTTGSLDGVTFPANGTQNLAAIKFDASGSTLWKRQLGANNKQTQGRAIAADPDGNVYIAGYTTGSLDGQASVGGNDALLVKYDPTGTTHTSRIIGTAASDIATGVTVFDNSVYLTGYTLGALGGASAGGYDVFIVKYDRPLATRNWAKQFGTAGSELTYGITASPRGIYVAASSNTSLQTGAPLGNNDAVLLNFAPDGSLTWKQQLGTNSEELVRGLTLDSHGNLHLAGYTAGTLCGTNSSGGADILSMMFKDGCLVNSPESRCTVGGGWGDPHLTTFDQVAYDFQGAGEFVLVESTAGEPLTIQVRQQPSAPGSKVALYKAVAVKVGTDRVAIYGGQDRPLRINGVPTAVTSVIPLSEGGSAYRAAGGGYVVALPGAERLIVTDFGSYMNLQVVLPWSRMGQVRGLLGNLNGVRQDDFAKRNGAFFGHTLSFTELYTGEVSFANSWRITQAESLFDYPAGQNTDSFTIPNFPGAPASTFHLPPAERQAAEQVCLAGGATDPVLLDNCILDVAHTGDTSFATGAAQSQAQSSNQGQSLPAEASPRSVYFHQLGGQIGPEWNSLVTSTTPAGSRFFLGEFSNEDVALSLNNLGTHSSLTLSFDLYVINGWDGDGPFGPSAWSVSADGKVLLSSTFSNTWSNQSYPGPYPSDNPSQAGALESNTLFYPFGDSIYRMKFTFDHSSPNLSLSFRASGLSGLMGESWGLANFEVQGK